MNISEDGKVVVLEDGGYNSIPAKLYGESKYYSNIESLYLGKNNITNIPATFFKMVKKLKILDLSGVNLNCSLPDISVMNQSCIRTIHIPDAIGILLNFKDSTMEVVKHVRDKKSSPKYEHTKDELNDDRSKLDWKTRCKDQTVDDIIKNCGGITYYNAFNKVMSYAVDELFKTDKDNKHTPCYLKSDLLICKIIRILDDDVVGYRDVYDNFLNFINDNIDTVVMYTNNPTGNTYNIFDNSITTRAIFDEMVIESKRGRNISHYQRNDMRHTIRYIDRKGCLQNFS